MSKLYIALAHYPVLNKLSETVLTSVTNLDIHDIARSAVTYGVSRYFIITPDVTQQEFIGRVSSFWQTDKVRLYNPDRSRALSIITITDTIESSIKWITTQEGMPPVIISTTAHTMDHQITFEMMRDLNLQPKPLLLIFGTGNGLAATVHTKADFILQPIFGREDYNHLSVRSAVAIILDRISSAVYKGRN